MLNQGQVQRRGPQGTTGTARAPEALNPRTTKSTSLSPARREDGEADLRGAGASTRRGGRGTKRLSKDVVTGPTHTPPYHSRQGQQAGGGGKDGSGGETEASPAGDRDPELARPAGAAMAALLPLPGAWRGAWPRTGSRQQSSREGRVSGTSDLGAGCDHAPGENSGPSARLSSSGPWGQRDEMHV